MQLKDFGAALLRRWYLVLFSVVCATAAAFGAVYATGATYMVQGSVLLLPPGTTVQRNSEATGVGNPWLSLAGVSQARDVVIRALMANSTLEALCRQQGDAAYQEMRAGLCKQRPDVTYEVEQDFISSAPMILVTVEADSPAHAATALSAVADLVPRTLTDLQANLKLRPKELITSMPVVIDQNPEVAHKDQIRAGILAGGGTLAVALLLIGLIDGLISARRAKAEVAVDEVASEVPVDTPSGWGWKPGDEAAPEGGATAEDDPSDEGPGEEPAAQSGPAEDERTSVTPLRKKPPPVADWGDAWAANQ